MEQIITHANVSQGDIVYVTMEHVTADKCEVIFTYLQFPKKILVKSLKSGEEYIAYPEWHCYETEDDAMAAATKYKEGYHDRIC